MVWKRVEPGTWEAPAGDCLLWVHPCMGEYWWRVYQTFPPVKPWPPRPPDCIVQGRDGTSLQNAQRRAYEFWLGRELLRMGGTA